MDFGLAFSYVFKDPDWFKKIALVAVIALIPIIGQMVLIGWGLEISHRVIHRDPVPLPDVDFGRDLSMGFKAFVVSLVYSLPIIVVSIPYSIIMAAVSDGASSNGDFAIAVLSLCFTLFAFLYGLALAMVFPASMGLLASEGTISAALNLKDVFALIKAAPVAYLLVLLAELIAGFISPLGAIACGIGVLLTAAYAQTIVAHFTGQAYNEAKKMQGFGASSAVIE